MVDFDYLYFQDLVVEVGNDWSDHGKQEKEIAMDGLSAADVQAFRNEMTMAAWDRYVLTYLVESEEVREVRVEDAVSKAADFADVMMRVRGGRVSRWLES